MAASSGSACASGAPTPSHVLTAMGYSPNDALGALRLTLGRENTEADVDFVVEKLPEIVERIRGNSREVEKALTAAQVCAMLVPAEDDKEAAMVTDRIEINSAIMLGKPVIRGNTRSR